MLRLVPPVPLTPRRAPAPAPQETPRQAAPHQPDRTAAEDCLAQGAAFATAPGAFETLMDWVEGRP